MTPKLKLILASACVLLLVALSIAAYLAYRYSADVDALTAQIAATDALRLREQAEAENSLLAAKEAARQRDLVASREADARKRAEAERDVARKEGVSLREQRDQLAKTLASKVDTIPTLDDARLAEETTAALVRFSGTESPRIAGSLTNGRDGFTANRPAVETSLRAVYEAQAARESTPLAQAEIAACQREVAALEAITGSYARELTAERALSQAARGEAEQWKEAYTTSAQEIALWQAKDKARDRAGFWAKIAPRGFVGAAVILGEDGRPHAGPGVGIGWRF